MHVKGGKATRKKTTQVLIPFKFLWTFFFPQKSTSLDENLISKLLPEISLFIWPMDFIQEPAD